MQLPNQWSLRPAGKQIIVGDFPVNISLHPQDDTAAVLHCGYGPHEVILVDLRTMKIKSRHQVDEAFYGLAFSKDGRHLYASGAGLEVLHVFDYREGQLTAATPIRLRPEKDRGIPSGLALSSDGTTAWVVGVLGHVVDQVDVQKGVPLAAIPLALSQLSPPVTDADPFQDLDNDAVTKRARALLDLLNNQGPFPYACLLDEPRSRLYISLWGRAAVTVVDTRTRATVGTWTTQEHPNEMVLNAAGSVLYVANANQNTVSVIDTRDGKTLEILTAEFTPNSPPGSTPSSLALSPDEKLLFVANANINAIAVFDVTKPGASRALGFIPTAWYPTSVRITRDGKTLLVANGKGISSKANRYGPQPVPNHAGGRQEYIGGLFQGSLSVIQLPSGEQFEEKLKTWTDRARLGRPGLHDAATAEAARPKDNPVPARIGQPSPIKYCIYIIKENRTYDQVLGDLEKGNGDPSLCLFPEPITPNHHKLARTFPLLDNFYVEGEVSADGHEWTVGAYASDYVERMWPMSYGHNQKRKYAYPSEGRFKIAEPAGGYLWDRAKEAGISYRSYGEFVNNGATTNDPCFTLVPALQGHFDPGFRSFDMDYSDLSRADRFVAELKRFEQEGEMPRLQILRLPNDHTSGTAPGKLTPKAFLAENDLALGRVIEAISHSRFWPKTAVFVVEDDAQDGPDHVDAHRTIAYVISPYARRGIVDSTLYSTASMLRTMELILGMKPMSQFDASATPMFNSFQPRPDLTPYLAEEARYSLSETNSPAAWGSELSMKLDFSKEDAIDDRLMNEIIWRSVRGPDLAMPAPVRAGFIVLPEDDE